MKHYELLCVIPSRYTEDETQSIVEQINNLIKKYEGQITLTNNLGNIKFAYPIKGVKAGYYVTVEFDANPEKIKELQNALKLTTEVLRFQIVHKKIKTPEEIEQEKLRKERMICEEAQEKKEKSNQPPKISLEELDKKLGEILEREII